MQINEVESQLGISKANIRFYERQGLLTPSRSENGYRTYSDEDIQRLKQIIILRKLGIPVQLISDILKGRVPIQDAIASNILMLQEELQQLNGALAICRQIQAEKRPTLDTERYWQLIQDKEEQGLQFRSLVKDYLEFMEPVYDAVFWMVQPSDRHHTGRRFLKNIAVYFAMVLPFSIIVSLGTGTPLAENTWDMFMMIFRKLLFWSVVMIPLFFLGRKYGKALKTTWVDVYLYVTLILILLLLAAAGYFMANRA